MSGGRLPEDEDRSPAPRAAVPGQAASLAASAAAPPQPAVPPPAGCAVARAARGIDRLIDAEANRAAEGLRVIEDVARFLLDASDLAGRAKDARHALRIAAATSGAERDTPGDVGTAIKAVDEGRRSGLVDLVRANAARAAEALRAAGEACALAGRGADAAALERARYEVYTVESGLLARLPAWRMAQAKLYVLVDPALCADPLAVAGAAARGGAGIVQLRAKALAPRAYRELAARMQDAVRAAGALFAVNDHVAVARAIAADAIHVGQDDLAVADVRAVVGATCAIGLSCHSAEQVAASAGADYLGLGPMFATATKPHEPCRGPELLDAARAHLRLPSFAIGGLDRERIRALRPRLPHGAAVSAAVCRAADPERAAAELAAELA